MDDKSAKFLAAVFFIGMSNVGSAQVLQVIGCEVENPDQFAATINSLYDAMSGGYRPTITLVQNTTNGTSDQTHTVLVEHPDYESHQAWSERLGQTTAAQLVFARSADNQDCGNQGLSIELASWGDRDAEWGYNAVFPVTTSDADAYAAAMADLSTSDTGENAPGATILYESRAGGTNTHVVALLAPDFATLNNYLDTLFQSDDFENFIDEVSEIRSLGLRTQNRRVRTWEP